MSQENVELVRKGTQAFLDNDFEAWFAVASPRYKLYPRPEEPGVKECYEGWDEALEYLINWYSGWKEYTGEPVRFIDAGDWVVVEMNKVGIAESGLRSNSASPTLSRSKKAKSPNGECTVRSRRHSKLSICRS